MLVNIILVPASTLADIPFILFFLFFFSRPLLFSLFFPTLTSFTDETLFYYCCFGKKNSSSNDNKWKTKKKLTWG